MDNATRMRNRTPILRSSELPRRTFFSRVGDGLHGAALAYLLGTDLASAKPAPDRTRERVYDLRVRQPDFEPKATSVIQFFMNGGPSQVDLFDPKPALERYAGKPPGRDLASTIEFINEAGGFMPSPFKFKRHGRSGLQMSNMLPHLAKQADDIAVIRSMFTTHFNHEPSIFLMQSGRAFSNRPSLGSWVLYGLGSENQNLPAYVVLDDPKGLPINHIQNWHSGWLPPVYQGTRVRAKGTPILNLKSKNEYPDPVRDLARSLQGRLDRRHRDQRPGQAELQARITNYELAARMQLAASDALDISQESDATREMYGVGQEETDSYGRRCLMARRLVERGVRLVQLYIEGQIWDTHQNLEQMLGYACGKTDQPVAALLKDLKQRGLLDSTLLVWGGEFGRLPLSQSREGNLAGRDHGPAGFSVWLAGGGVKGGTVYGSTDEIGFRAVENRVSVHDLHATILHQLGLDHRELVMVREGRSERLTDEFPARVVKEILA